MSVSMQSEEKAFTTEQANAMLPLVRVITRDIVELSRSMMERRERLNELKALRGGEAAEGVYFEELQDVEECLKTDANRLKELVLEISQLGLQLSSLSDGIVNFISEQDGRRIFLSWQLDENRVGFWHELDEGFADRKPLEAVLRNRLLGPSSLKSSAN